jgi:acetyltransferase-like isoleucine patch superfamily enzyme
VKITEADRASYRNRGGFAQRAISRYKAWRYFTACGDDVVVKHSAQFMLVENAVLEVGAGCTVQDYAFFQLTMPTPKVYIGNNTVIGRHCVITSKNSIRIGNDVLMGSYVQVIDHSHGIERSRPMREQRALIDKVEIGDDVWIGAGAKILMGAKIGRGAVIGANAVVRGEVPDYAIAVGAPAKVIKYRE